MFTTVPVLQLFSYTIVCSNSLWNGSFRMNKTSRHPFFCSCLRAIIQTFDDFNLIPQLNLTSDRIGHPIYSSLVLCESDTNVIQENGLVFVLSLTRGTCFVNVINCGTMVTQPDCISKALPINQGCLIRFCIDAFLL